MLQVECLVIKIMTKIHQSAIMSAPTTSQYAAITALKECDGEIDRMRDEYNMRRRLVVKAFNDMGLTCFEPRGAFYAFPCIKSTGMSSQDFCTKLLEQKHVLIYGALAVASSALLGLIPGVLGDVLSKIPILDVGVPAITSVYFDWFSGVMQAFIFCMLTVMYIANAAEE